jgi:hypothetical protein
VQEEAVKAGGNLATRRHVFQAGDGDNRRWLSGHFYSRTTSTPTAARRDAGLTIAAKPAETTLVDPIACHATVRSTSNRDWTARSPNQQMFEKHDDTLMDSWTA